MRKVLNKTVTYMISLLLMSTSTLQAMAVHTDEKDVPIGELVTVAGVNEKGVFFTNGTVMEQAFFEQYSGTNHKLQYGDVVYLYAESFTLDPMIGSSYHFQRQPEIEFLGNAFDYYDVKELTVTSSEPGLLIWEDADGVSYHNPYFSVMMYGYTAEIDCADFQIGDSALCAVSHGEKAGNYVVLPLETSINSEDSVIDISYTPIVVAVNNDGDECLLSNGVVVSQRQFQEYSGEEFELEVGDVISVTSASGEVGWTDADQGTFIIYDGFIITYCGKVKDYYADNLKELTVGNSNGWSILTDEVGTEYRSFGSFGSAWYIENNGLNEKDFSFGDQVLCVVGMNNYPDMVSAIILEKTYQAEYVPGDVTGEGDVNLMDVISVNRHIMIGEHLTPAAKKAADLNGDGKVTPAESLQILRYVVKLEDSLG